MLDKLFAEYGKLSLDFKSITNRIAQLERAIVDEINKQNQGQAATGAEPGAPEVTTTK